MQEEIQNNKKKCCSCLIEKDLVSFSKRWRGVDGYEKRCKICMAQNRHCINSRKEDGIPHPNLGRRGGFHESPYLVNPQPQDWKEMFEFLKKIGYDYNSEKTIHEQFCEKWGIEPRKKMYEKNRQFTPKDLGLI